jgi:hypothetical protein
MDEFGFMNVFSPDKPCKSEREKVNEKSFSFGTEFPEYYDYLETYELFGSDYVLLEVYDTSDYEDTDEYVEGWEPELETMMDMDDSDFEADLSDWQEEEDEVEFPVQF